MLLGKFTTIFKSCGKILLRLSPRGTTEILIKFYFIHIFLEKSIVKIEKMEKSEKVISNFDAVSAY